jgi:putative flippase GtrA
MQSASLLSWLSQRSIVRFAGVGAISTTADILLLHALYPAVLSIYWATAVGFLAGLTIGFLLNGRFVFGVDRTARRYIKYGLASFAGLMLTEFIIHILYQELGLTGPLGAKLVAVGVVFFWNYSLSRFWAFR